VRNYTKHWDLPSWGNALSGEVGELLVAFGNLLLICNTIKKIERDGNSEELTKALGEELGDVLAYTCLLAQKAGLDLQTEAGKKFNKVCERMKKPEYIIPEEYFL
jgi:NTP pyrophosphatase (non-canonical NTP hydrolase)